MFIVILFIFLGITAGYVLRTRIKSKTAGTTVAKWSSRLTTWLIWLLLFMLGIEVGGNEHIMQALPTLGVEALVVSVLTILGSCVGAWMLWKYIGRKGGATR